MPAAPADARSVMQAGAAATPPQDPPSLRKQAAQLVIIPAVIAIIAIGLFWLFGSMAASPDSLNDQLARLKQSSGYGGNLVAGAQDPRYKDRCQAAFQVAAIIGNMNDEASRKELSKQELAELAEKRAALSKELVAILQDRVHPDDEELLQFMLMAIGQLAQPAAMEQVLTRADSPHWKVRAGVAAALLSWSQLDVETARRGLPALAGMLDDQYGEIRTYAASAIWKIATPADSHLIAPLREAMSAVGTDPSGQLYQTSVSHAAIALASLGDDEGAGYVAGTLLDRQALARMRADSTGQTDALINANEQDHMIAATLFFVPKMKDERVWRKVQDLAEHDPSVSIRNAALRLLDGRDVGL